MQFLEVVSDADQTDTIITHSLIGKDASIAAGSSAMNRKKDRNDQNDRYFQRSPRFPAMVCGTFQRGKK